MSLCLYSRTSRTAGFFQRPHSGRCTLPLDSILNRPFVSLTYGIRQQYRIYLVQTRSKSILMDKNRYIETSQLKNEEKQKITTIFCALTVFPSASHGTLLSQADSQGKPARNCMCSFFKRKLRVISPGETRCSRSESRDR